MFGLHWEAIARDDLHVLAIVLEDLGQNSEHVEISTEESSRCISRADMESAVKRPPFESQ